MNLRNIDLNLLVVFDVLVREGNVSRAAQKIGLSQSAMSNALNRLRELLEDPVLVRTGIRMVPTPKAKALLKPVQNILSQIEYTLETKSTFNPSTSKKRFVILTTDYCEFVILPKLMPRIMQEAPGIKVEIKRIETQTSLAEGYHWLEKRQLDLAILNYPAGKMGFRFEQLFRDELVSMTRIGHPLTQNGLNLKDFLGSQHVKRSFNPIYHSPQE